MKPHLLCIGGEDHYLRVPFLLALRDKGFRISAAGTGDQTAFARAGIEYHPFHMTRFIDPLADWASLKSLSRLIGNAGPTLVQCFDTKLNILVPLAARAKKTLPIVSTINGLGWLYSSRSVAAFGLRPAFLALQKLADCSTTVTVFQNRDDERFFLRRRLVRAGRNKFIPSSGIDIARFEQAAAKGPPPAELRCSLGLGEAEVVLTVTRMTRQKGIPTLLEAAAIVHRERPGVRFLLAGPRENEGPMAVTQGEIDRHSPYVQAIGLRSDVPALLGIADVFAFPTELREGVPRVLLEAAAAARPIVTTRMPGCNDVIRDGWNGYLVPPRAPQALADKILVALRDRDAARILGRRAAMFVREEFNLDLTVARYASVYEALLTTGGQAPPDVFDGPAVNDDFGDGTYRGRAACLSAGS